MTQSAIVAAEDPINAVQVAIALRAMGNGIASEGSNGREIRDNCRVTPAPCQERKLLADRLRADMRVYRMAMKEMDAAIGTSRFAEVSGRARAAREAFERAQGDLHAHISMHGCDETKSMAADRGSGQV